MKWLRNRKRWAARRAALEHARVLERNWEELRLNRVRLEVRLAALPVHLGTLNEIDLARRRAGKPDSDALLLAHIGALR